MILPLYPPGTPASLAEATTSYLPTIKETLSFLDEATDGGTALRAPLRIEVVRPLTEEDLVASPRPAPPPSLRDTKNSHHTLAKLCAEGRGDIECSRMTGYSVGYVNRLRNDPTFRELVLHYTEVVNLAATDFLGAMRETGMDMLDELRRRVEGDPSSFSHRELMEAMKLLLVEPMKSEAGRAAALTASPPIAISFITSGAAREAPPLLVEGDPAR